MNKAVFSSLIGLCAFAVGCDLPMKDLGNETESAGGDDDSQGDAGDGTVCEDGDTMNDGCNDCSCLNGAWACTAKGCPDPTGGEPEPECEPGQERPADDGCNTCVCTEDGFWACTEIGCGSDTGGDPPEPNPFDDGAIEQCDPATPRDALTIAAASLNGNTLTVELGYSGGCAEHLLGLCYTGEWMESDPVQINAYVAHDSMGDPCDAYPVETREFDLQPLAQAYEELYNRSQGEIIINFEGWNDAILYSF